MTSDRLWNELAFRLPLPSGKPRYADSLYIAGDLPSTQPGNYGMRVNWDENIQSAVVVFHDGDGTTVCEHALLQWSASGQAMRKAVEHFASLRDTLVAIVQSLDPHAIATVVDEDDHEMPYVTGRTRQ